MSKVLQTFNCPEVNRCKNDLCFFRKRDIFGMNVWAAAYNQMTEKEQQKHNDLWSDVLWPRLQIKPGTNCYNIICLSQIL